MRYQLVLPERRYRGVIQHKAARKGKFYFSFNVTSQLTDTTVTPAGKLVSAMSCACVRCIFLAIEQLFPVKHTLPSTLMNSLNSIPASDRVLGRVSVSDFG
ncbi:MAG: hypothetical protein MRK00_15160 [Nitrosomonas sp.]|nr:hypothetical protein [Nitrosomonas sp.]